MSYESEIIVVDRYTFEGEDRVTGFELMRIDLSSMGYGKVNGKYFSDIFDKPIDFDLYRTRRGNVNEDGDTATRVDCYGAHCGYTDIDTALNWLRGDKDLATYRREKLFFDTLLALKAREQDFDEICLVHFGY